MLKFLLKLLAWVGAIAAALAALDALGPKADFLRLMAAELLERKK